MARPPAGLTPLIDLDRDAKSPLYVQLYEGIRDAILTGRMKPGARLPATRALADDLEISRMTVETAYGQLRIEGYVRAKVGAGTFVTPALPDRAMRARRERADFASTPGTWARWDRKSRRARALETIRTVPPRAWGAPEPFRPATPAVDAFPLDLWRRVLNRRLRKLPPEALAYAEIGGYRPLREAIASYITTVRGANCGPEQVIVVGGAQHALYLAASLLVEPGDEVWIEEPAYYGGRAVLDAAGARLVAVPVDGEGLRVDYGIERARAAALALVTPSHQYPMGVTLSCSRRLSLLDWAARSGSWIVENDYDSEYRFRGRPLQALQGLDARGRVIYVGSFSKSMFPALRLGYVVAPPALVDAFTAAAGITHTHPSIVDQMVLADFIADGYFERHVRHMRRLYAERQDALIDAVRSELRGAIELNPVDAGMHVVARLPAGQDDAALARRARRFGLDVPPLSLYYSMPPERGGFLLGFAAFPPERIRDGARRLAALFDGEAA